MKRMCAVFGETLPLKIAAVLTLIGVVGCNRDAQQRSAEPKSQIVANLDLDSADFMKSADQTISLDEKVLVISEADFRELKPNGSPAHPSERTLAARTAATANHESVLGAFGTVEYDSELDGSVFIVAKDAALAIDGTTVQSRQFFIAAVRLSGRAAWVGRNPKIAADSSYGFAGCADRRRGCVLRYDSDEGQRPHRLAHDGVEGAGLPSSVIANSEMVPGAPGSAVARTELRLYTAPDEEFTFNSFNCRPPIEPDACNVEPRVLADELVEADVMALKFDAVLIRESDFLNALGRSEVTSLDDDLKNHAFEISAAANDPAFLEVSAEASQSQSFTSSLAIVVRDVAVNGSANRYTSSDFYVAVAPLAGTAEVLGTSVEMRFKPSQFDVFTLGNGLCGSVSMPDRVAPCYAGVCPDKFDFTSDPMTSNDGWFGDKPRVTTWVSVPGKRPFDIYKAACRLEFEPPQVEPCFTSPEVCNGKDDNCNGLVDDSGACASRDTTCTPIK